MRIYDLELLELKYKDDPEISELVLKYKDLMDKVEELVAAEDSAQDKLERLGQAVKQLLEDKLAVEDDVPDREQFPSLLESVNTLIEEAQKHEIC